MPGFRNPRIPQLTCVASSPKALRPDGSCYNARPALDTTERPGQKKPYTMRHPVCSIGVTAALTLASCGGSPDPVALRLVDLFEAATVEGTVTLDPVDPTEWRFDGEGTIPLPEPPEEPEEEEDDERGEADDEDSEPPADLRPTFGWAALNDIEGFEVVDGRLVGTAGELAVLHVVRPEDLLDENDLLHAVEITMQVSAGTEIGITFNGGRQLNEERVLRNIRNAPEPPLHTEADHAPGAPAVNRLRSRLARAR